MTKQNIDKEKNGTNMPFFHSLGVFLPIYNRERAIRKLLEQKHKNDEKERNEAIISRQTFLQTQEE